MFASHSLFDPLMAFPLTLLLIGGEHAWMN